MEHYITTGGVVVAAIVTAFGAIQVALIQSGRRWSKTAAERSKPTSNGFAASVTKHQQDTDERLGRMERRIDDLTTAVLDHLNKE